jgi:hypothetical protein
MPKREFDAGETSYRFDTHRVGYGYTGYIAVNVKCYVSLKLDSRDKAMVKRLGGEDYERRLFGHCHENVQQTWWEDARHAAIAAGLGDVVAEGRQGGWLVLSDWPVSRVEELVEERETRCHHCDAYEQDHVNDQCLFAPTRWLPKVKLTRQAKETLDTLDKYVTSISNWVPDAGHQVIDDFKYQLHVRYEEEFPQLELFDVLGEKHE